MGARDSTERSGLGSGPNTQSVDTGNSLECGDSSPLSLLVESNRELTVRWGDSGRRRPPPNCVEITIGGLTPARETRAAAGVKVGLKSGPCGWS